MLSQTPQLYFPVTVWGEYLYGLQSSRERRVILPKLIQFTRYVVILEITSAIPALYAQIRHDLRLKGRPIPDNDIWIAALAWQHQQPILSRDAHFDHIPQITRIGW